MYQKQEYISSRPKSGYKKRNEVVDYDSFARVTDTGSHEFTPRSNAPPRPVSRRRMERNSNHSESEENCLPSSPDEPLVSPKSPTTHFKDHSNQNRRKTSSDFNQPSSPTDSRPPTSGSMRPPSASVRRRSARTRQVDNDASQSYQTDSPETLSNISCIRPPSSFSKYRPLPAIGTPTPTPPEYGEQKFLFNDYPKDQFVFNKDQLTNDDSPKQHSYSLHNNFSGHGQCRISSAVSDISVISTKANSSRGTIDTNPPTELIERLDLSQLDKQSDSSRRRKVVSNSNQSPCHKPKPPASARSKFDAGELYDGDDDDSDTNIDSVNTFVQGKKENIQNLHRPSAKDPVIIPSQDQLAVTNSELEILLAVKLPTNGTRHQRYFHRNEPLMTIVEFAEEQAGQDFAGYVLVSSGPKYVYEDLHQTIEEAGLEDRSMLHLEEMD